MIDQRLLRPRAVDRADLADSAGLMARYESDSGLFDSTVGGAAVTADAAPIKRWEDVVGGYHLTQQTTASAPVLDATRQLVCSQVNYDQGLDCPAAMTIDRQDFTLVLIGEFGALRGPYDAIAVRDFRFLVQGTGALFGALNCQSASARCTKVVAHPIASGDGFSVGGVPYSPSRCLIVFRGSASGMRIWINDTFTDVDPLTAGTSDLGSFLYFPGFAWPSQYSAATIAIYSRGLSNDEVLSTVWKYAYQSKGVSRTRQHQVIIDCDSNGMAASTAQGFNPCNRTFASRLSLPATVMIRNFAYAGSSTTLAKSWQAEQIHPNFIPGETNILVLGPLGGNDIQGDVSAATVWANLGDYCSAARAAAALAGATLKIIPVEISPRSAVYYTAPREAERVAFNATLNTNWPDHFDIAPVNLTSTVFADPTNVTYYSDGIHWTDALHGEVANRLQLKIEALLP